MFKKAGKKLFTFANQGMTSIQEALHWARRYLQTDTASLDAQRLLEVVLGVERAHLLAHPEQPLTAAQYQRFAALVERCAAGEPLPYVLGRWGFYDRDFHVTPAVLIPRPETELVVEQALAFVRDHPGAAVVDAGTGSGALAVTLAANAPQTTVYAADISPEALAVARHNAALHQTRVTFFQGDLLQPLIQRELKVDLVMANLPYVATGDLPALAVSRYEPRLALDGGADGLDLVRRLLAQAPAACNAGGLILLEIGADQSAAALAAARVIFPQAQITLLKDLAGLDRVLRISLA